ncbi:ATP-binding protein [Kribbella sp. NPDC055071]
MTGRLLPAFRLPTLRSGGAARITWPDVALAVVATAVTQVWLVLESGHWVDAPLVLAGFIVLTPLTLAIRRINPVLALTALFAGAYIWSVTVGEIAWPLLAASLLAAWTVLPRWGTITCFVLAGVAAALPLLADGLDDYTGFGRGVWTRLGWVGWRWRIAAVLIVWVVVVVIARWRWGRQTTRQRVEDLLAAVFGKADALRVDALIGLGLSSLVLIEIWAEKAHGEWWTAPRWMPWILVYTPLTLAVRRRWPAIPAVVLGVAALVSYWQTNELWAMLFALSLALYSLGTARPPLKWSVPTAVLILAALAVFADRIRYPQMSVIFPRIDSQGWDVYATIVDRQWPISLSLSLLVPVCAGIAVRLYARNRQAAAREAELEEEAVEREAEQVVLTERSIIARDLHDVVAHAVNLMVIQAETGPDLVQRGEADVLAGYQRIGDAGRRALGELDRLLSALRDEGGVPDPQLAPQPGLGDLRQLVNDVSSEQLPVELELVGNTAAPPEGHQLTAYRLVQEGLTNAVRHAKATRVRVTVEISDDGIAVAVADDGAGFEPAAARKGGRHGLTGMGERVRVHHGTLDIETAPGAGTVIKGWIPLGDAK